VAAEIDNVRSTLLGNDGDALTSLVERLADLDRPVAVISGEASAGVAAQFASQMRQLRPGVTLVGGTDVAVRQDLAVLADAATVIVIDLRRYEQWVLDAHRAVANRGIWSAGISDSMLSPVAAAADVALVVAAASPGPFDSYVGVLSLLNLVATDVAARLTESAISRLAAIEAAWGEHGSLTSGP